MEPRAKKSLGQHFLRDRGTAARIIDLLCVVPEDRVLEIGPGPGALTGLLRRLNPKRLVLVEKDDHWAAEHARCGMDGETVSECIPEVRHGDALEFAWEKLSGPWKIVGNLPYNVASPLMWDIVSRTPCLERAVFMVQKEVADRLAAAPGSRAYGALSVWIQSHVQVRREFVVGPHAFSPPPKVDSGVVCFTPLSESERSQVPSALAGVVKACFQQRRKQMGTILRHHGIACPEDVLAGLDLCVRVRPETLSPRQFCSLAEIPIIERVFGFSDRLRDSGLPDGKQAG